MPGYSCNNRNDLLRELYESFQVGIRSTKSSYPMQYLKDIGLNYQNLDIGFNSGRHHYRKSVEYIKKYEKIGILTPSENCFDSDRKSGYRSFGSYGIIFPLKNKYGEVCNFFAKRIKTKTKEEQYLNDEGLFPEYPSKLIKRLFIVPTILECASIVQSKFLENQEAVISLEYGNIQEKHIQAIFSINQLEEIVLFSYSKNKSVYKILNERIEKVKIHEFEPFENKSINDVLIKYGENRLRDFLRQKVNTHIYNKKSPHELEIINPQKLKYTGKGGEYYVLGSIPIDFSNLLISLHLKKHNSAEKLRIKIDLYDTSHITSFIQTICEQDNISYSLIKSDIAILTELLEAYRDKTFYSESQAETSNINPHELTPTIEKQIVQLLQANNLTDKIADLLTKSGIIGENDSKLLLYILAFSYKTRYSLHGLIQGESGSGKSHLINTIVECMPREDVINLTRVTGKSFYHYKNKELHKKIVIIQDFDGLDEDALFAFREMQSSGFLTSSTTEKNRFGEYESRLKKVSAHFSSISATTKAEIYLDNYSRSVVIGIDETENQSEKIVAYQNKCLAGEINEYEIEYSKTMLRNCVRVLHPYNVKNPFATSIKLPIKTQSIRRLNNHFQSFVALVTILNQYQRKKDLDGQLLTTKKDVETAINIFFNSIWLKVDELDNSTRIFFERLKKYVLNTKLGTQHKFTQREIRQELNIGKTKCHTFFSLLKDYEYIKIVEGSSNRGYVYAISFWDYMEKLKNESKSIMLNQLKKTQP